MNLIVETDLGHDPDDLFAILWLLSIGVNIRAITLHPGDLDQVAMAKFITSHFGLDCPVGVAKLNRDKLSSGSVHHQLLKKYKRPLVDVHDGPGDEIIADAYKKYPDSELFVIGPVTSVAKYLKKNDPLIPRVTMQGGFLAYDQHNFPCRRLEKFEGKNWVPTFNLNGDRPAGLALMAARATERRFVTKNVCHTVIYNKAVHERLKPHNEPSRMFKEAMDMYLEKHDEKKFHDPTAAVCHVIPEVASWVRGNLMKIESGWGTKLNEDGDYIIADIDYDRLWNHICNFNSYGE